MSKITSKEALEYADKLREFCKSKKGCKRCPFKIVVSEWDNGCVIKYPDDWDRESAIDDVNDRNSKIEEMLDDYYNSGSFGGMG